VDGAFEQNTDQQVRVSSTVADQQIRSTTHRTSSVVASASRSARRSACRLLESDRAWKRVLQEIINRYLYTPIALRAAPSHMPPMPYHRFKVGQTVVAPIGGPDALIPRGPLTIVRLMPLANGEPQYRVRSSADGLERVVPESQLRRPEETLKERQHDEPTPARPGRWRR
jgi:hypothetical protein